MESCLPAGRGIHAVIYFVYVLKSLKNGAYYKGLTNNIERRIREHNAGKTSSNRSFAPFRLIFVQEFDRISEARKFEKFLKTGYGREIIKEIDS